MATQSFVQSNGDKVTWRFRVTNSSSVDCFGAQVAFTIPTGVSLTGPLATNGVSISVPVGSYNPTSDIWFVGDLPANTSTAYIDWEFTVDDISQASSLDDSFIVSAVVTSRCTDGNSINNTLELMITVGQECIEVNVSVGVEGDNTIDPSDLQITV